MIIEEIVKDPKLLVPLCFDDVFKAVFENHPEITALFMSKFLQISYEEVENNIVILSKGQEDARVKDKHGEKDIVFYVSLEKPFIINLEANITPNGIQTLIERNLYYFANLFGNSLKSSGNYAHLKSSIQFNFNNFYANPNSKNLIEECYLKYSDNTIVSDKFKIVRINSFVN